MPVHSLAHPREKGSLASRVISAQSFSLFAQVSQQKYFVHVSVCLFICVSVCCLGLTGQSWPNPDLACLCMSFSLCVSSFLVQNLWNTEFAFYDGMWDLQRYHRPPDKSAYWKTIFYIFCPKHMLWVLKRTVSMRRFFWAPKHVFKLVGNNYSFTLIKFLYLDLWYQYEFAGWYYNFMVLSSCASYMFIAFTCIHI